MIMKLTKSLLLMCASLGLFACSNEEIPGNGSKIEGPVDIAVKINLPSDLNTKALSEPTRGDSGSEKDVDIESITVTLNADKGENTVKLTGDELANLTTTFEGVENPHFVSVKVNYTDEYSFDLETANTTYAGLKAPMDGKSDDFISTEEGKATINVQVAHKLARLEFSGIQHVDNNNECIFTQDITIEGSFLQDAGIPVTKWEDFKNENLWDKFSGKFLTNNVYPADNKCTAYNIEGDSKPIFTLAFDNVKYTPEYEAKEQTVWVGTHGYAIVDKYKITNVSNFTREEIEKFGITYVQGQDEYEITKFPAGYIYTVTSLEVPDEAIKSTINGNGVNITATINVTPWTVVNGTVEWK